MESRIGFAVVCLMSWSVSLAQVTTPLTIEARIPLGNIKGRIDHLAIDASRQRLFVAELGNGTVGVVDLNSRTVTHRLTGLNEPQGIAYIPATDTVYVASGGDGMLRVFRGPDLTPAGTVNLGSDADNIRV